MDAIYIAQGKNGLLKVGKSGNPAKRHLGLRKEFLKRGDVLVRFEACEPIPEGYVAENIAIETLANHLQQHSGREWFYGGTFENAIRAAREITEYVKHLPRRSEKEIARMTAHWAAERAAAKAAYAAEQERLAVRRQVMQFRATVCLRIAEALTAA